MKPGTPSWERLRRLPPRELTLLASVAKAELRSLRLQAELLRDPTTVFRRAGMEADAWQREVLTSAADRILLVCSRQIGKSETAAALALLNAILYPPALVLIVSPTQRQSGELFRKVKRFYGALVRGEAGREPWKPTPARVRRQTELEQAAGEALVQESALQLEMANGSRIVALPGKEATIRSFSAVKLLIIDEAARTSDELYSALRPMLAVSHGRLVALSSAWAKQGWFWEAYDGKGNWLRIRRTALECPRLTPEFLESERQDIGPRWYAMEYMAEFSDPIDALFTEAEVARAMRVPEREVWFK
jgi:terminase large subunit-like protein